MKSKHFGFVAALLVGFMLVAGNWVTSAQANSVDSITSTPTGTPIANPNGQGEPVSAEQQEDLKGVIQTYFKIRYNTLSASQPYGFQLMVWRSRVIQVRENSS